ncbi:MAG: transcriptional regulator [Rothia sp. (in: high G+C Gram-positive bacteria)]|uniref:transcriptional regulator n=1 Tax=Rothia sp. (in: high G+C Gram-positive bacteria) TaxID=1885016 RepID=UPI0026E0CC10|nr:transcriptional regulator [Rothia sp. (in: high G+C Gram-positive bacteria)]MDO5750915.1 transcriptional regulator [Rothia sp. (in: high G+C Gram-positive bacteria)]
MAERIELKYNPHEGIDEPYLILPDTPAGRAAAADFATYISRAKAIDPNAAIRLSARGNVLAAFACSLAPEDLFDTTPIILGMRALHLGAPSTLDIVVQAQALLDRLARIEDSGMVLYLPPVTMNAPWAGQATPMTGWQKLADVDAEEFQRASREGIAAVEKALPENPGHAVLATVRSRIWSSPMILEHLPELDGINVPTGAAFALTAFGFMTGTQNTLPIYVAGDRSEWLRIAAPGGHVLVRR